MKNLRLELITYPPHLLTGNFFSRWSEELKKLLMTKIYWVVEGEFIIFSVCPSAVSQGLSVELAWKVPIWDQRPWTRAMNLGTSCAFSSGKVC